ncbi:UPF0158 family protein [Acetivibrio cellulolyticus]|uniref:UPF0158 family protein n=1 Tax=Acetivibrio cellulolyticus TaxID=35830 RepID=UPI0001E2C27C|nr:UPF0158 family protein [Acetivibrio cellulolyticus]
MKPVKLKDIIDQMDTMSDEYNVFLDKETGKIFSLSAEEMSIAEESEEDEDFSNYPEWQQDELKEALDVIVNWENYVELPSKFDIDEYSIMEEFCDSISNSRMSDALRNAIQGRGAFRKFKDTIQRLNIEDSWYKFKEEAFRKIAVEWCEDNCIEYV